MQLVPQVLLGLGRQELCGGLFDAALLGNPAEQGPPACLILQLRQMHAVVPAGHTEASVWATPSLPTLGLGCIPTAWQKGQGSPEASK